MRTGRDHVGGHGVAHIGEHGERIDVEHREHGVEVHAGALRWDLHRDHLCRRLGSEQPLREQFHAGRVGALAHADQHRAVADHERVTAFQEHRTVAVAPHLELGVAELRVVLVDRLQVQRLPHARRLAIVLTVTPP